MIFMVIQFGVDVRLNEFENKFERYDLCGESKRTRASRCSSAGTTDAFIFIPECIGR